LIRYLDASAAVPIYVNEDSSFTIRSWFRSVDPGQLALSHWTMTEFASALGIRVRMGTLLPADAHRTVAAFLDMVRTSLLVLPVLERDFTMAGEIMLDFPLALRAGDALHIAVASHVGATTLVTLDQRMARAAERLGLACEIPA
jgi:predicted nucleic acid-binding protein